VAIVVADTDLMSCENVTLQIFLSLRVSLAHVQIIKSELQAR